MVVAMEWAAPVGVPLYRDLVRKGEAELPTAKGWQRSDGLASQHVTLPQRALLTFSLRVLRPTAPTTTSEPTT